MKRTHKYGCLGIVALLVVGLVVGFVALAWWRRGQPYRSPSMAFEGDSRLLRQTQVVPTLDTPIEAGSNVVWCGTMQLAWQRLADDVLHGPPAIDGAAECVARLNRAELTEQDFPAESYYAAAGLVEDGITGKIEAEMLQQFQREVAFDDASAETIAVAYAYLQTHVKFTIPYFENREPFLFKDSLGHETAVTSFGIRREDDFAYDQLREQVEVLYQDPEYVDRPDEFIVDLCRDSSPNQIVLACIEPMDTLATMVEAVEEKVAGFEGNEYHRQLGLNDVLLVPDMYWEIDHRFAELEGTDKPLSNPGFEATWLGTVRQNTRFRLDRSGAELRSEVKMLVDSGPTRYVLFDRPFLVWIKKRGAERPFFVMWVDNAELLCRAAE